MNAIVQRWDSKLATRASMKRKLDGRNRCEGKGHPTTAEIQYTAREMEFLKAIEDFKNRTGRKFPTHREILHVIDSLGYRLMADRPPGGYSAA